MPSKKRVKPENELFEILSMWMDFAVIKYLNLFFSDAES